MTEDRWGTVTYHNPDGSTRTVRIPLSRTNMQMAFEDLECYEVDSFGKNGILIEGDGDD